MLLITNMNLATLDCQIVSKYLENKVARLQATI
jgi:hypothetical protein